MVVPTASRTIINAQTRIVIVDGVPSERRRWAVAALAARVGGGVVRIAPNDPSLRGFVYHLARATKRVAPGARFSFGRAFAGANVLSDPVPELARWLTTHFERVVPAVVVEGIEHLRDDRPNVLRLLSALAAAGAARITIVAASNDDVPLARWLADDICALPIGIDTIALPDIAALDEGPEPTRDLLAHLIARGDRERLERFVRETGLTLIDLGDADAIEEALAVLGGRSLDPIVMTVSGVCEARRDHADVAESWFRNALALVPAGESELEALVTHRFAGEFVRRGRFDVAAMLQPFVDDERIDAYERASMLALLAEAAVAKGDAEAAIAQIERALAIGSDDANRLRRARLGARAGFVYHNAGDAERASALARETIAIATAAGLDELAAAAFSVLQALAYDHGPDAALEHIYAMADSAIRSSNRWFHVYALTGALELEVERANVPAIERVERELESYDVNFSEVAETVVPARALVAAWTGDFARAYELLAPAIEHQKAASSQAALRLAELAVYAAAAGLTVAATNAVRRFDAHVAEAGDDADPRIRQRARLFAVLARTLLGVPATLPPPTGNVREDALREAVRAIVARDAGAAAWGALDALHDAQYGGVARLLAALPTETP